MGRLKLIIAYDGTCFSGWQSQPNRNGVQDHLETALRRIIGKTARVHGAGRTDAGVHALAQCAHVDVSKNLAPARWRAALNALLPPTIRVLRVTRANSSFHARFAAKGKIYRYRIWCGEVLPPFEYGCAWHIERSIDQHALTCAAKLFVGRHDFARFTANRRHVETDTTRTIFGVKVANRGSLITIEFDGEGFLYKMARLMVGALVDCSLGKTMPRNIEQALNGAVGIRPVAAPAAGLFLVRVRY